MTEFDLIESFFTRTTPHALIGNGDDAAVIAPREGHAFAITTDTMIESRHYLPTLDPQKLGRRLVHVNLSDLAAMGAVPRFATLSLTLPRLDEHWLSRFSQGLWQALDEHQVELVGGNTTRGPASLTMTAIGEVPVESGVARVLVRSGAQPGDELWVSGRVGDAGWALACMTGVVPAEATREQIARYEMPTARVALGVALRGIATSCIDISDGLLSEANHIAKASKVAIDIDFAHLPSSLSEALSNASLRARATECLLTTGDAYELLFTAPQAHHDTVTLLMDTQNLAGACIGRVTAFEAETMVRDRVQVLDSTGRIIEIAQRGWDHFA